MAAQELAAQIAAFVADPNCGSWPELVRAAFALQGQNIAPYQRICAARGLVPGQLDDFRAVPLVPVLAFKTLELAVAPAREVFRSSGTTGSQRSVHYHPFPELYRQVINTTFPRFCWPQPGLEATARIPLLSLVPSRQDLPDSSLGFMFDHILARFGNPDCTVASGPGGLEVEFANAWCARRLEDGQAGVILTTAFALLAWLEALAPKGQHLALPRGTVVLETGGFKGRSREISRAELLTLIQARLGIPPERVVREYGMTELTGHFYTQVLHGGDPDVFVVPHFLRVRVLDPESLEEVPMGQPGVVAIFDLSNLGSALHLLTEDWGVADPAGFRLLGRAPTAELRGCSLLADDWLARAGHALNKGW